MRLLNNKTPSFQNGSDEIVPNALKQMLRNKKKNSTSYYGTTGSAAGGGPTSPNANLIKYRKGDDRNLKKGINCTNSGDAFVQQ